MLSKNILIHETETIKGALKKLDKTSEKILLIVDKSKKLQGTISDGDIRRCILKGSNLGDSIRGAYNHAPIFFKKEKFSIEKAKKVFLKSKVQVIPILDKEGKVIDFITWDKAFRGDRKEVFDRANLDIPVVIMAGGKGARLEPFSKILPKSLIPVGEKPIIEIIIDKFRKYGIENYYLTLNYKGKMVEAYFETLERDYKVHYIWDGDFSGTAGSLKLLQKDIADTFIVSNCDVFVNADFEEVVAMHKEKKALLTVLSSIRHHVLPYGVIEFKEGGDLTDIHEKAEHSMVVNTGVYVLDREALQFISKKSHFDMTDLIKKLVSNKKKVIIYPVNENDFIDIGQWEEYRKALQKLQKGVHDEVL